MYATKKLWLIISFFFLGGGVKLHLYLGVMSSQSFTAQSFNR